MNRRLSALARVRFVRLLGAVLLLLSATVRAEAADRRPNIVYIVADDLDAALFDESAGLRKLTTDEGVRFERHYVSLAMCCPSRATALRGQFGHNTGVLANHAPVGGFAKAYVNGLESSTVGTWLQDGGYRTALVGKYLNGYPASSASLDYVPPGWDYWAVPNDGRPYTQYHYSLNVNGRTSRYGSSPEDYLDDRLADHAVHFIRTADDGSGRPFFLYFAPYNPHGPGGPPPRYASLLDREQRWRPASYNEADTTDKPAWIRGIPLLTAEQRRKMDRRYTRRQIAMLTLRDLVSKIVNVLEARGLLENTYIVFTSDNGYHLGEHRFQSGKQTAFEEDIHVPLVVRGPGIAPGSRVHALTVNADFAPTFAELARVNAPAWVDGRSLVPLLTGQVPAGWRDAVLLEGAVPSTDADSSTDPTLEPPDDTVNLWKADPPPFQGLRTRTHTYVEYEDGQRELYDDVADPAQLSNLYPTLSPAEALRYHDWVTALKGASGAELRAAEVAPPASTARAQRHRG